MSCCVAGCKPRLFQWNILNNSDPLVYNIKCKCGSFFRPVLNINNNKPEITYFVFMELEQIEVFVQKHIGPRGREDKV